MAFTVTHEGGTKDVEFQAYARLLRQGGVDLARVPRAPEPETGRRWLYVWNTKADAQAFADELKKRTGDKAWHVVPVKATSSKGPLGPALIQVVRQSSGLTFALHPLSRAMVRSAFPAATGAASVVIDVQTWYDYQKTHDSLTDLAEQVALSLTGLQAEQLHALGYAVIDADTETEWAFVSPGDLLQG